MTRPLRPLVTALALLLAVAGVAACGIDEDQLAAGGPTSVVTGDDSTTSTAPTTESGGPDISLPDIPSDVTEPDDTIAEPTTTPDETLPDDGQSTPGGLTAPDLEAALVDEGFTAEQAECITIGTFSNLTGEEIDALAADEADEVVLGEFEEVVQTCVQGG